MMMDEAGVADPQPVRLSSYSLVMQLEGSVPGFAESRRVRGTVCPASLRIGLLIYIFLYLPCFSGQLSCNCSQGRRFNGLIATPRELVAGIAQSQASLRGGI